MHETLQLLFFWGGGPRMCVLQESHTFLAERLHQLLTEEGGQHVTVPAFLQLDFIGKLFLSSNLYLLAITGVLASVVSSNFRC